MKCKIFVVNTAVLCGMFALWGFDIHLKRPADLSVLIKKNNFTVGAPLMPQEMWNFFKGISINVGHIRLPSGLMKLHV